MYFVLYRVAFCLFNAVGVDERSGSGYVTCAASSASPKSEPQLGLALGARAAPFLLYPPGLSSTTSHLLPYFPQAPIHP